MMRQLSASEMTQIYQSELIHDFPAGEVKPLEQMLEARKKGNYFACGYYDNEELAGYAFFIRSTRRNTFLLDYLAVLSGRRSGGYGSKFLTQLKEMVQEQGGSLILEVENPDYAPPGAERDYMIKRIGFYEKNGLHLSNVTCNFYDNEYRIMYAGEKRQETEVRQETEEIYREFFGDAFIDRYCVFHDGQETN